MAVVTVLLLLLCLRAEQAMAVDCSVPNCDTCVDTSAYTCATCSEGYFVTSGQCYTDATCGVANCKTCLSGSIEKCEACNEGFNVTSQYRCSDGSGDGVAFMTPLTVWCSAAASMASLILFYAL